MATERQKSNKEIIAGMSEKRKRSTLLRIISKLDLSENARWSWIYVMKCQEFYKIGITYNLENRHNSLQSGNPFEIEIIFAKKFKEAKRLEGELHNKYIGKKIRREWFSLSEQDIHDIKNLVE